MARRAWSAGGRICSAPRPATAWIRRSSPPSGAWRATTDRPWASVPCWCRCRPCPAMAAGRRISGRVLRHAQDHPGRRHRAREAAGSWAGAFGQTQFMPSTYLRLAVDGDGDGRRDLIDSVPDALASTANFLKHAGWNGGMAWGYEVRLPAGSMPPARDARTSAPCRTGPARASRGPTAGPARQRCPGGAAAAGRGGPAFLVTRNFDALYSYNAAESYALAIAHLSDRLRGGGPLVQAWPTDDPCRAPSGANCRLC